MTQAKRVLVVDDEPDIVYTIKEICEFAGYEVLTAGDGQEGIDRFKEAEGINLMIVDYHMPKVDGLSTVKRIRELDEAVAILVLTVDERQEVLEKFMAVGATDFSVKPIKAPDLISRMNVNMKINEIQLATLQSRQSVFVDKGISKATLDMIEGALNDTAEGKTIREISDEVSLAYQTVHRYMKYLMEEDMAEVVSSYGRVGRPLNYYRLKK